MKNNKPKSIEPATIMYILACILLFVSPFLAYKDVIYRADNWPTGPWRSSLLMPRWASRISVPVVNVRVERVQDISEADVLAEGISSFTFAKGILSDEPTDPRWKFIELWDSINAKRGMGWDVSPWVWGYEFPKFSKLEETPIVLTGTSPISKPEMGEEVQTVCSQGYGQAEG